MQSGAMQSTAMQLHLIDGTYELYRAFYGAPKRRSPAGLEVGGTYGITAATLGMLDESGVTHVAAAFDSIIESWRNERYEAYKTGAGIDPELWAQFPLAERAMEAIGVTVWPMYEFETDDALATAVELWADQVDKIVVHTPDKDMAQLYGHPRVVGYNRRERAFIDAPDVVAKFGVPPESIPDYLALVGDSADGYPGLSGWGAKSSSTVLAKFLHIESIPLDHEQWGLTVRGAAKLATTLRDNMADAVLFKELATLRRDVPLVESLGDLEWRGVPRRKFTDFCSEFGFTQLMARPSRWDEMG
ncbi:MAG: flap endonuclease [Acidimicrobiia bacterium]|nr:flap endonuclease [Acidimicrobiia bacterium]